MEAEVLMRPRVTGAGFTLVEVVLALVMLSVVLLGSTATSAGLIRAAGTDRRASQAGAAVDARISLLRQWPDYAVLESFAGTEPDTPLPGWQRRTTVARTGGVGQPNDFKRITVTVEGTGLSAPVVRSITVAAP
jgi:prepilin-type N-terminal cleavage/methylation domain-containing protein